MRPRYVGLGAAPTVMRAQLRQLLDVSQQDFITVQVLPFICTADPGVSETFWMLEIGAPAILNTVLITHLTGRLSLENEAHLVLYRKAFDRLCAVALPESDSQALVHRIISEL
ncbi:MAG: family transcriptional regulator [Actinomycetia bacterium]|nr:family transcriptional regulator [Actinomycetes bacterium]